MHPPEVKQAALDLIAAGHNDCEVSRRLGVPRRTIVDWRRPTLRSEREYPIADVSAVLAAAKPMRFTDDDYAELLGIYLGDGWISHGSSDAAACASHWTRSIRASSARPTRSIARCFPRNRVDVGLAGIGTGSNVSVYSSHLDVPVPAARPGKKARAHDRARSRGKRSRSRACAMAVPARPAFARTAAASSTGPAATSTSATSSRTIRRTSRALRRGLRQVGVEYRLTNQRRGGSGTCASTAARAWL